MKKTYKGKKLLILGANPETSQLVDVANKLEINTIVTSNVDNEPAKKIAWKSYDINGLDVKSLEKMAREEHIDGVLVGVADILLRPYYELCESLNLPCYATKKIVDALNYKDTFKETCEKFGIRGIPNYQVSLEHFDEDVCNVEFPVMVKPVDGYSGLGMSIANDADELKTSIKMALSSSKRKKYIVERYMHDCGDVGIYYTFLNGKCSVSCTHDRHTTNEQPGLSRVCLGCTYPSKYEKEYFDKVHDKFLQLFSYLGIKNGVLLISAFYDEGEFYVYDPGFRLQGEAPHLILNATNKYDQRKLLIDFALNEMDESVDINELDSPRLDNKNAASVWFLLKAGTIGEIKGLNEKDDSTVAYLQRFKEGDIVKPEWIGTEKQVLARIYLVCDSKKELIKKIRLCQDSIKVTDTEGNNMLLQGYDSFGALS